MAAFDHIMVLVSFVYAVALTHLLSSAATYIRSWRRLRFSWIYASWYFNVSTMIIANWISFWDMRSLHSFSVGIILFIFALAFTNYLGAALVSPEFSRDTDIDLVRFHEEHGRQYVGAFAVSAGSAVTANAVLGDGLQVQEWSQQNLVVVPMLVVAIIATVFVHNRFVQCTAALSLLGIWTYYFAILQASLS